LRIVRTNIYYNAGSGKNQAHNRKTPHVAVSSTALIE
jgi:hypothetical protein